MEKKYTCVVLIFFGICHGVSQATECTARGRFLNDESADCRGYIMCLFGGLRNITQYKLMCPMGSVYSHIEKQCTNATNYKCFPSFNCTSVGNFAVPESKDCSSYVACIEGLSGIGTARVVGCPPNTLFYTTAGVCVSDTVFSCTTSKLNRDVILIRVDAPEGAVDEPDETISARGASILTNISLSMIYSIILLLSVFK